MSLILVAILFVIIIAVVYWLVNLPNSPLPGFLRWLIIALLVLGFCYWLLTATGVA